MKAITISGKKLDLTEVATITVVSDNIDSAKFTVPKTYDGVSLATGVWYLRYALTDGSGTSILLTSAVVGDNVEIIWPIEGGVVSKHGQVTIQLICLDDGIVFQSLPGTITVSRQVAPSGEPSADATIWAQYLVLYQTALTAAQLAETNAETAETGAVTAQGLAEDARDAAVVAKNAILNDTDFIAVAAQLDDIATVAGIALDVAIVAAGISDIDRVEAIAAEITTVAGISEDVSTVAGIAANVTTVAGDTLAIAQVATDLDLGVASKIKIVADDKANVDIVAGDIVSVNTVATDSAAIAVVAGDKANIDIVAGVSADVTTVAGVSTEVGALGARTAEIDALYAEIDNIGTKATVASVDAVKVKTTENDLAIQAIQRDQTLANQSEAKITTSDYGIVALTKNATGNLKMKREGLTARNEVINGSGLTLTGWVGGTNTSISLDDGIKGTSIIDGNFEINLSSKYIKYKTGDVINIRFLAKSNSGKTCGVRNDGTTFFTTQTAVYGTSYALYSYVLTVLADGVNKIGFYITGATVGDTLSVKELMQINLTQTFSSIPTLAQCKNIFPAYFADTKSVAMTGRYRGRGKNIFDKSKVTTGYYLDLVTGLPLISSAYIISDYTKIKAGATYFFPNRDTPRTKFFYADLTPYSGISDIDAGDTSKLIPTGVKYVRMTFLASTFNKDTFQLELGSTATTYAPFEAHDLYLTAPEGRSVLSAKDSVEVQDGKLVHVKRVSDELVLTGSTSSPLLSGLENWAEVVSQANDTTRLFETTVITIGKIAVKDALHFTSKPLPMVATDTQYVVADANEDISINTTGVIRIRILKTRLVSQGATGLKTWLSTNNQTIQYELATPITTPIDQDGAIPAGASVYWEPAIPDVGIYTTKFEILDTDHPIASIDKLYKVDFATGVQTLITDAVIAGDGLSFTSASLTDGDLVNVIYFYTTANPEGMTTAEYLNSNVVVADSANGKYYKYKPTITNGAIASWTITEVV